MKEYRLVAWPELQPQFNRTAYRRMLTDMSHRYVSIAQLASCTGLRRLEVSQFVDMLDERGLLVDRDLQAEPEPDSMFDSMFDSLRPLGGWIRNALHLPANDQ